MIIANINLPRNCFDCQIESYVKDCPCFMGFLNAADFKDKRTEQCPLKEVPKVHGKIGDLDSILTRMKERDEDNGGEPLNAVDRGYHLAFEHLKKEIDSENPLIESNLDI